MVGYKLTLDIKHLLALACLELTQIINNILLCSMVQVLMLWTCGSLLLFMRQLPKQGKN